MKIRVKKVGTIEGGAPPVMFKDHLPGTAQPANYSLPIAYEVVGDTDQKPEVGNRFYIFRTARNGVKEPGSFITSTVTSVIGNHFTTANSIYEWHVMETPASI